MNTVVVIGGLILVVLAIIGTYFWFTRERTDLPTPEAPVPSVPPAPPAPPVPSN
jgi:hypothetical protein